MPDSDGVAPQSVPGFRQLARDSALYAVGPTVGKAVGLLLLPVLTRSLSTADFGRYDVLSTLQTAATSILLLGFDVAATRLYAELSAADRRRMFGTWLALIAMILAPLLALFILFRTHISHALFGLDDVAGAIAFTGIAIAGSTVQIVGLTALRNHQKPIAFAMVSSGSILLNALLLLTFLPAHPSTTTVMAAIAIAMLAGAIGSLAVSAPYLRGRPTGDLTTRLVVLALPLAPAIVLTWVAEFANRAILLNRGGASEVAFLSVAIRFASLSMLVVIGFQRAWQPVAFAASTHTGGLARIAADGRRIMVGVCISAVAVALLSPEIVEVVSGSEYIQALPALGFSLLFSIGLAGYHVATLPSAISNRMRDLGIAAGIAAVAGVTLNIEFSARWGSAGTAAAIAVGQFAGTVTAIALSKMRAPVPFEWSRIGLVAVAATAACLAATLPSGGLGVMWRILVTVMFTAVLVREGTTSDLLSSARASARSRRDRRPQ